MRVLIVRVGAMGDVLHALPAVAALRRAQPEWNIDWVVDPRWAPLLVDSERRGAVVDGIHLAETKLWSKAPLSGKTLRSIGTLRLLMRELKYDLVVDMQGTMRSAVIGRLAKGTDFVGYADPREAAAAKLYGRMMTRRGTHVVEQGAALLGEACGFALSPHPASWTGTPALPPHPASWMGTPALEAGPFELPREPWADEWAAELAAAQPVCVLAASAGWGAKQWPTERFGELARELRTMGYRVLANAGRRDDAVAARVVEASDGAAELAVCTVAGLIALMRRTSLLVGGDSGPTHLAAALAVPLVGLYGPTDPARNGPWGTGRMKVLREASSVTSHKKVSEVEAGLARISVEQVVEAVREFGVEKSGSQA
jgi:heptosyltransferase-1